MASDDSDLDPLWHDLDWSIGQIVLMGWDGIEVTPQIRSLIEDHHLGSIILTAKNLKCWSLFVFHASLRIFFPK
jgi:beta-N-acetylhexosaminidase